MGGNWRIVSAIFGSLVLHGLMGWWAYGFFPKYAEPIQRAVTHRFLRLDVFRPHRQETKDLALLQHAAISRDLTTTVDHVQLTPPLDQPSIQTRDATPAVVDLNPSAVNQFLFINEVDTPAMPVGDWVIDFSGWPPGRTSSLVVEMWISAAGKLEHWELVGDPDNREVAERSLSQLADTPINPALLNGHPVASFRRIEILIDIEP